MSKILSKIEALAAKLAEKAVDDDTAIELQVEAVKVLSPYYTLLKKERADDVPEAETIGALQRELKKVEESDGKRAVPIDTRRRYKFPCDGTEPAA